MTVSISDYQGAGKFIQKVAGDTEIVVKGYNPK